MKKIDQIRTIIIDDDNYWQMILKNLLKKNDEISLEGIFSNTQEAYEYLTHNNIDLIFLDIQIKDDNGIDLIKRLKKIPAIIIIYNNCSNLVNFFHFSFFIYLRQK